MTVRLVLSYVCIAIIAVIGITTRFTHADLTETQLFLAFWHRWAIVFALACAAVWLVRKN